MFLGILSLITAICYSIALIIGACPFDFILPGYGKIIMVGVIFALYVIAIATLASKKGKSRATSDGPLPFEKHFEYPYVERKVDEDIEEYLQGEALYLAGQRGKAKNIWLRLAKKYNIDAGHALMCYFIDKDEVMNVMKYNWAASSHGYAAFNLALIYLRASLYEYQVQSMPFSFKMDLTEYRKGHICPALNYIKYFRISAMQDVPEAQYNLGVIYQTDEYVEKNLYLSLYWFYRGAMRGHGGSIRGLCEVYKELLPICDSWTATRFSANIKELEKWIEANPDKICEKGLILKHFGVTFHEKHERLDDQAHYKAFIHKAISRTKHTASYSNITNDRDNHFTFDRYSISLNYRAPIDAWSRIASISPKIILKGSGSVTYGTYMTGTKEFGVSWLSNLLENSIKDKMCEVLKKDPYCVLAFESSADMLKAQKQLTQYSVTHISNYGVFIEIDEKGISSEKYVYIPPKEEPTYSPPPKYEPSSSSDSFSYCSLFFSDGKNEYHYTDSTGSHQLTRDVSNPNIFYDSSGNKFYSSDNGESVTRW